MGLKSWLIRRWGGTIDEKKAAVEKEVKGYELYDQPPGGKWVKVLDLDKPVDFEELEDAQPGHTYKLQVRYTDGRVRQIWYRQLPGAVTEKVVDPIDVMEKALAPMAKFGERITALQENIRGAFGWALPHQPAGGGGGGGPLYEGNIPAYLHPRVPQGLQAWGPVLKDWTKSITEGVREGVLGGGSEGEEEPERKAEFKKPRPDPTEFLRKKREQEAEEPA